MGRPIFEESPSKCTGDNVLLALKNAIFSAETERDLQDKMYRPIEPQVVKKFHRRFHEVKKYICPSRTPVKLGEDSQLAFVHNILETRTLAEAKAHIALHLEIVTENKPPMFGA